MRLQKKKKQGNIVQPNTPFIQPKLKVGQVGDKYEVEADRVADKVVNNPAKKPKSLIQKMEAPEEEVQQKPLASSITKIQRQEMPEEENVQKNVPVVKRKNLCKNRLKRKNLCKNRLRKKSPFKNRMRKKSLYKQNQTIQIQLLQLKNV